MWGVECRGYEKIAIFGQYLANLENVWNANRKLYPGFRMISFSMILSDLK